MGRHRRSRRPSGLAAWLRRFSSHPSTDPAPPAPARPATEQLSLLTQTGTFNVPPDLAASTTPLPRATTPARPATPPNPPAAPELRVVGGRDTVESARDVMLCYPDGSRIPVGWSVTDPGGYGRHRRYIADVPPSAHLATGMVIRAGSVMVPVKVASPPTGPDADDWYLGGAR